MDQSLEQRIRQLETQLHEQQRSYENQLYDHADLNLLCCARCCRWCRRTTVSSCQKRFSGRRLPPKDRKKPERAAPLPALRREPARSLPAPPVPGGRGAARRAGPGAGAGRAHSVAAVGHAQAALENRPTAVGAGRGLRARCLVPPVAPTRALEGRSPAGKSELGSYLIPANK